MKAGTHTQPFIKYRSKKGSSAVFLCLILSSLIMIGFALIMGAREHVTNSRADAVLELSADSLLSEFHREIYDDYGLFLVSSDEATMSRKLQWYTRLPFRASEDVKLDGFNAGGRRYLVLDPEPVQQQITAYMKSGGADKLLPFLGELKEGSSSSHNGSGESGGDSSPGSGDSPAPLSREGYHNLKHGPSIVSLPSRQLPDKDFITGLKSLDRLRDLDRIFSEGTDRFLLSSYALGTFNTCRSKKHEHHFFHNEVEYILFGELTDQENEDRIRKALTNLRFPSNLAHIYADPAKQEALLTAAEAIAPGPAGLLLQAVMASAWAYGESMNDAGLLLDGYRVPPVKDGDSWAMDLESIIKHLISGALDPDRYIREDGSTEDPPEPESILKKSGPVIRPSVNKGLSYEDHLRILLFFRDDGRTVMRIMDLIQINMRKDYDGAFLISEQCTGLSLEFRVNGRQQAMDKVY